VQFVSTDRAVEKSKSFAEMFEKFAKMF